MNYTLKILIQSPVLPGSGEGWAGLVDNDIIFDDWGIPYIPARRIRGVLRDCAVDIVHNFPHAYPDQPVKLSDVELLFGKPGLKRSSPLLINNAYIESYRSLKKWLSWTKSKEDKLFSPNRVLQSFTVERAQTAIEDGIAKEHSLRNSRMLKRKLKFECLITLEENKDLESMQNLLALSAIAMRAMGNKRNRGFGQIESELWSDAGGHVSRALFDQLDPKGGV